MAYTVFNILGGSGDDKGSGSTTGAPVYTSTGGNWDGTSVFTPNPGDHSTPASSISVGDYVSVCTDASTATSYVAQVTAVAAGIGGTVTLSTTVKYGTVLASQTGTATLKNGGAWNTFTPVANFGAVTVPQSTQINVKAATYTLSANLTLGLKGATTTPLWYRGYNTTAGDLDNGSTSLAYPTVSQGGNQVFTGGSSTLFSGLAFSASLAGTAVTANSSAPQRFSHCRFANADNSSSAVALSVTVNCTFVNCYFSCVATVKTSSTTEFIGCYFNGTNAAAATAVGVTVTSIGTLTLRDCTFNKFGAQGVSFSSTGTVFDVNHCTFNACLSDGIRMATIPGSAAVINCLFRLSGGYDINNTSGTNTAAVLLANNASYSPTSGHLFGFGDWAELNPLTELSDPCVSAADLHLLNTAVGAGAGLPGQWENVTGIAYPDVGAWQRQVTAGGGAILSRQFLGMGGG